MAKKWMIAGWLTAVVIAVAWCLFIFGFGVSWEKARAEVIPQGTTWAPMEIQITTNSLIHSTAFDIGEDDHLQAIEGAILVLVTLDYSLSAPVKHVCGMTLLGHKREWEQSSSSWMVAQVVPGVVTTCNATDEDDNMIISGTMGAIFEIPALALDEIRGVRVSVSDPRTADDEWNIDLELKYPSALALLEISP